MKSNKIYMILIYINIIYVFAFGDIGIIIIIFFIKKMKGEFEDI